MALRIPALMTSVAALGLIAAVAWARRDLRQPEPGPIEAGRRVPRRRCPGGSSAGDQGDRGVGRLHRRLVQGVGAQDRAGGRGWLFPAVHHPGQPRARTIPRPLPSKGRTRRRDQAVEKSSFQPLAIGSGGTLEGVPIVFAGYGISAKDEAKKLDYDDYAGIDVKRQGRADHPPRAPARRRQEPVRRQTDDHLRDLRPQGDQRLPARRRACPARQRPGRPEGDRRPVAPLHRRRDRGELAGPVRHAHPGRSR